MKRLQEGNSHFRSLQKDNGQFQLKFLMMETVAVMRKVRFSVIMAVQ